MSGLFAVASSQDCVADLFYGTDYHSHLGTRRGGLAVLNGGDIKRVIHDISNAQFRSKFEDDILAMRGRTGIGIISDFEDQPLIIGSKLGTFAIVTVGVIHNAAALVEEAYSKKGVHFSEMSGNEINPTELAAALICSQGSFAEGVKYLQSRIEGSCSLVILGPDGLYAARDRYGRTPVVLGGSETGHAVASESCAFHNLGYRVIKDLGPGEVVRLSPEGYETVVPPGEDLRICAFLYVYYGYPASTYEGVNVEESRYECGAALARRGVAAVDFVSGVPDSGVAHALGYAYQSGLPYKRPFVKYTPTWPRSFMPQDQRVRSLVAKMKLIPVRELAAGHRILFCDDSIVRGTQLKDTFQRLYDDGAKEIHLRIACPPLMYGCPYLNFSRSKSEYDLAARQVIRELEGETPAGEALPAAYEDPDSPEYHRMIEGIRRRIGPTSLAYQRLSDMVDAIGLPADSVCTYCWNRSG